jgi:glycosyltransferase involved in cell wall biosynthesis
MGAPSVVVKNTAPAEVITDGLTGLVCSDETVSLCDVLEHYLFEMSENERENIRMNAQKSVPLPWETVMTEVEQLYRALI